ncbi:MAG TPA: AzlC family ABC transporter permease [Candidatus Nanopelagicaceae bacterium]|nr:AzlC family ABC transporter permease [Candidatus Nanopelagicaceae bacterium]
MISDPILAYGSISAMTRLPDGERRRIRRDGLSLAFTVGMYGTAFGAASVASGLNLWQTSALSLLTFSGASQFALVGVLGGGGSALSAIATSVLLGSRNALYGLRLAPSLKLSGARKFLGAQLVIDESTAVSIAQEHHGDEGMHFGFWVTGLGVYVFWNLFTLLGALTARAMGDPATYGLDAAVPAAFIALLWPRLKGSKAWLAAATTILLVLVLVPVVPAGIPVIASALIALGFGWREGRA